MAVPQTPTTAKKYKQWLKVWRQRRQYSRSVSAPTWMCVNDRIWSGNRGSWYSPSGGNARLHRAQQVVATDSVVMVVGRLIG